MMKNIEKVTITKINGAVLFDRRTGDIDTQDFYILSEEEDHENILSKFKRTVHQLGYDECGYGNIQEQSIFLNLKDLFEETK